MNSQVLNNLGDTPLKPSKCQSRTNNLVNVVRGGMLGSQSGRSGNKRWRIRGSNIISIESYTILGPSCGVNPVQHPHRPQGLEGHGGHSSYHSYTISPLKNVHSPDQSCDVWPTKNDTI